MQRVTRDWSRLGATLNWDNALGMEELVQLRFELSNYHPKHNEYDAKIADRILGKCCCVFISQAASWSPIRPCRCTSLLHRRASTSSRDLCLCHSEHPRPPASLLADLWPPSLVDHGWILETSRHVHHLQRSRIPNILQGDGRSISVPSPSWSWTGI